MANFILCACLFRVLLPILTLTCVAFRPSALSGLYLILLLYSSIVPIPTLKTMAGHTGIYLKVLIAVSFLALLGQASFQIVLFAMPPYGHFLVDCETLQVILKYCGFVKLKDAPAMDVTTWLAPEITMTVVSVATFVFCKKLTVLQLTHAAIEQGDEPELVQKVKPKRNYGFWISVGKYLSLLSLCIAAVLKPSIPGGFYFLVFMGSCTWWACYKELGKGFAIVCRFVMFVVFCHIVCLYTYQFEFANNFLNSTDLYARLFGLTQIYNTTCDEPLTFTKLPLNWDAFLNPLALVWLFYILGISSKHLLKPKSQKKQGAFSRLEGSINGPLSRQMSQRLSERRLLRAGTSRHRWQSATRKVRVLVHHDRDVNEHTPLIRGVSPSRKYGSGSKKHTNLLQDSTGSVTVTGENDIPLREIGLGEFEEEKPGCFEKTIFILESLIQFMIQSSYIVTNIIMMTWSITYHSWLTFVLLLWANILWMIPNQRRSMLRSSPFLVFYALFLLISAYIYSMDLNDTELPIKIGNVRMEQIGFKKITEFACHSLLVKSAFTVMFWITLRQHMRERKEVRQSNTLADMAAPLQVTVGAATGVSKEQEKESEVLKTIGEYLKKFFTRFWIWVVACTLFAVAITGERMTGFRILYMALFLFFIISFQISFRIWLKMMFAFWLTVIIYSMIILILVYTYQFDYFPEYWTKYLYVEKEQQLDIGLETYGPTQLFVRLATPTFFVIITVIQLHYFHKDFMALSTPDDPTVTSPVSEESSSAQGKAEQDDSSLTVKSDESSLKIDLTDIGNVDPIRLKAGLKNLGRKLERIINVLYVFFELHMPKIILLIAIVMSIYDKCALYLLIVLFVIMGITLGRKMMIFVIYSSSIFVSVILLSRMVYQIQYIKHDTWNVTCPYNETGNETFNTAQWFGFQKTVSGRDLPKLVQWNIVYILAVTLYSVIVVRQFNYRLSRGKSTKRAFFVFPQINRAEADKNLLNCLKYLTDYGFYKFGVEICLMATVALIGFRMDIYAILYALWLIALFALKRQALAKVWPFYLVFIAIFIPIQYVMVVGLPPDFCIDYPWKEKLILRKFQEWSFLMDSTYPPSPKKIVFDTILLLFVSRQAVVFRIEKRFKGQEYPGGSNESIIHFSEEKDYVIPVPDFVTYTRSYLDVAKRMVLLGFMWITLAIVFLAGTNRVNLFSVGYLVGSFIFLWQGSDIYLRPIPRILKSWNILLGYNVIVIFCKTILQLVGCVFLGDISDCWLVQLLGIGCVRKFGSVIRQSTLPDDQCPVPREYIGLVWDGICFGFLIMQRRIFCSYNFFHMINETKATTILASRGAELIEQLRQKRTSERDEQERRILEKIKAKMDKIKATQQKIQGPTYKGTENHFVDGIYPHSRPFYRKRQPKTYKEAIRSGDYYMFDDMDDDDDLEMIEELKLETYEDEEEEVAKAIRRDRTLGELLSTAMRTNISTTIRDRRASMPLARQKSTISGRSQYSAPLSAPAIIEESPELRRISTKRAKIADIEPQPGTSKDDPDISEITEPKQSKCQKIMDHLLFIWAFVESLLVSLTNWLNLYSKDYRYVVKVLGKERKLLKQTNEYTHGIRMGRNQTWQPAGSYHTLLQRCQAIEAARINSDNTAISADSHDSIEKRPESECSESKAPEAASPLPYSPEKDRRKASVLTVPEIRILAPSLERGLDSPSLLVCSRHQRMIVQKFEEYDDVAELSSYDQPTIIRFALAIWAIILSHSDILCYFVIFLNQMKSATFLSLPLPLLVFLWGTLTVPRPSKNFWVTIIAYTQLIVLIKCLFQFEFLPWNREVYHIVNPMNPARIFGVERRPNYAIWDLLLLLIVFFHRYMLKSLGLWKTTILYVPAYESGEYMIDEAEVYPLRTTDKSSKQQDGVEADAEKTKPVTNDRKDSDLERLVEESEEPGDEDNGDDQPGDSIPESVKLKALQEGTSVDNVVLLQVQDTAPYDMFPDTLRMNAAKYSESIKDFFNQLKDPSSRVAVDVYSYMFMCDFFNFFVILIGYSSFGTQQGDGGVSSYLEDNRVPTLFLLMLILQFTLILVDRAIFLRKHIIAKIVFQFIQIIVLHVWLFVLFPAMTERNFNSVIPPQMYYMVKCFYLLLSAYQIRCGYPSRILGNFLCKGYNYVNMFLFKGFMLIPFLFELRTVMDWMWTDTSMTVFDWIKMEDIFAHIFLLKCTRHVENEYPQPRGERKSPTVKYLMGGLILFVIVAIIWFPLVFFSLGNAVGEANPPLDVTLDIRIGPYEPVYHLSAQSNSMNQFKHQDLKDLINAYKNRKVAAAFISNYEEQDVVAVKLSRDSSNIWSISPPDRDRMIAEVNSSHPISIRLIYTVTHPSNNKDISGQIREENVFVMESMVKDQPNPERQKLLSMLSGNIDVDPINLGYVMPKFLKVTNRGTAKAVPQMMDMLEDNVESEQNRKLYLALSKSAGNLEFEWWKIQESCGDQNDKEILYEIPYHDCNYIVIYTFNDRIFPETLNIITGGGIIGLYTTLVFVASRILRGFFGEICFKIMFDDMPNVDRVLQLCLDIYLVREAREFCLEEDLFAKLVFLFRSPETLIKWTRPKEELGEDEDPEGEPQ